MDATRYLIVNADDFGQSPGVNRGIIEAREHGIVTSASLMVRWPAAEAAAAYGREHPSLSLGLHVDFGEWAYRDGSWVSLYEVIPLDDPKAIRREAENQLATFRHLVGKDPTHIDSHQHVHLREVVRPILLDMARALNVPLRLFSSEVRYCGHFYGQTAEGYPLPDAISVERLLETVATLPPGLTELSCHPGEGNDLHTMYSDERAQELTVLCDPRVRAALISMEIELRSFRSGSAVGRNGIELPNGKKTALAGIL
jgi:chitin disaccharide deacetylase